CRKPGGPALFLSRRVANLAIAPCFRRDASQTWRSRLVSVATRRKPGGPALFLSRRVANLAAPPCFCCYASQTWRSRLVSVATRRKVRGLALSSIATHFPGLEVHRRVGGDSCAHFHSDIQGAGIQTGNHVGRVFIAETLDDLS